MNQKKYLAIASIAILITSFGIAGLVSAAENGPGSSRQRPTFTEEQRAERQAQRQQRQAERQAMQEAIANNDYAAFQALQADGPLAGKITETNFAKFVKMHQLRQSGNQEEANAIAEELGLPNQFGHFGQKHPSQRGNCPFASPQTE